MTRYKGASGDGVRLYFFPGTRAVRARWLLEELGVSYALELVDLRKGANKAEEYLAVHPLGKIPALEIDGTVIFESLAICLYLCDRYWDTDLAPVQEEKARRAEYYKWMAFSVATLEPAIFEQLRRRKEKDRGIEPVDPGPGHTDFDAAASYVDRMLSARPFLTGADFSAADVMNGSLLMFADKMELLGNFENIRLWLDHIRMRPAYLRASGHSSVVSKND